LFRLNLLAFFGAYFPLGTELAGFYSTAPLEASLSEPVDFSLLNRSSTRLTVGAADARTSKMPLTMKHVIASAALPPAFPPVHIDGEYYWDGGILSNTPTEAIFDDHPRRDSLVFGVNVWNPMEAEPKTIWDVLHRHKEIQYSSRIANPIVHQQQVHRLRHVITELVGRMPEKVRNMPQVRDLVGDGCVTHMHIVTLLAPRPENEGHPKVSISAHRASG
jgi:NTE family protein